MDKAAASRTPPAKDLPLDEAILNVPNQLTIARLVLAVICFVFLALEWYFTALVLFVMAAATDWIDGYWARRYGQITQIGRILDPFADKIVICGAFIFLAAVPLSEIKPWMAVVVVGRELLVTGVRSFFEERGVDFSAAWAGKWKMVFQCIAVGVSLYRLTYAQPGGADWATQPPEWMTVTLIAFVWLAVLTTVYSGWGYMQTAARLLRSPD